MLTPRRPGLEGKKLHTEEITWDMHGSKSEMPYAIKFSTLTWNEKELTPMRKKVENKDLHGLP